MFSGEGSLPGLQRAAFSLGPPRAFPLCVLRERERFLISPPLIRIPIISDEGPTLMTSFDLNYLL